MRFSLTPKDWNQPSLLKKDRTLRECKLTPTLQAHLSSVKPSSSQVLPRPFVDHTLMTVCSSECNRRTLYRFWSFSFCYPIYRESDYYYFSSMNENHLTVMMTIQMKIFILHFKLSMMSTLSKLISGNKLLWVTVMWILPLQESLLLAIVTITIMNNPRNISTRSLLQILFMKR